MPAEYPEGGTQNVFIVGGVERGWSHARKKIPMHKTGLTIYPTLPVKPTAVARYLEFWVTLIPNIPKPG